MDQYVMQFPQGEWAGPSSGERLGPPSPPLWFLFSLRLPLLHGVLSQRQVGGVAKKTRRRFCSIIYLNEGGIQPTPGKTLCNSSWKTESCHPGLCKKLTKNKKADEEWVITGPTPTRQASLALGVPAPLSALQGDVAPAIIFEQWDAASLVFHFLKKVNVILPLE